MMSDISKKHKTLHYTISGKGKPLVLLHGFLGSSRLWGSFGQQLAVKFKVIAVDLPGHGKSPHDPSNYSMEGMACRVKDILDKEGISRTTILGHSMGGYVALRFAGLYPDMMASLILLHSHPFADNEERILKRRQQIQLVQMGKKDLLIRFNTLDSFAPENKIRFRAEKSLMSEMARQTSDEAMTDVLKGMMERPDTTDVLRKPRFPILWILGAKDSQIDHTHILKKFRYTENLKITVLEHSGHLGFIEEKEHVLNSIHHQEV